MDRMDERREYEEIIKENLDYNILCQDPKFDFLRSFLTSNLQRPF